jgi:hypothetical protein
MPTDVSVAAIRKEQAKASAQSTTTILLLSAILGLLNLALILTNQTLAEAVALTGLY